MTIIVGPAVATNNPLTAPQAAPAVAAIIIIIVITIITTPALTAVAAAQRVKTALGPMVLLRQSEMPRQVLAAASVASAAHSLAADRACDSSMRRKCVAG
ncbi:MAG: hypothetical protein AB1351_03140 [Thermoproteota archaeon]